MNAVHDEPIPNVLLRDARKRHSWTQKEVAERIGVATLTVNRWERGETVPSSYARRKLCLLFNARAEELGFSEGKQTLSAIGGAGPQGIVLRDETPHPVPIARFPPNELLRAHRIRRSWSQEDLATKIGTSSKNVGRWERGKTSPSPYFCQRLCEVFDVSPWKLGLLQEDPVLLPKSTPQPVASSTRTIAMNWPMDRGDCERPEITAVLETIVIDVSNDRTTFYLQFTNGTTQDLGLRFENVSLTTSSGDFHLGRSVGSFLVGARQSIPLSVIFDMTPQENTSYQLNIVLIRPNKWRNAYRPIPLAFEPNRYVAK